MAPPLFFSHRLRFAAWWPRGTHVVAGSPCSLCSPVKDADDYPSLKMRYRVMMQMISESSAEYGLGRGRLTPLKEATASASKRSALAWGSAIAQAGGMAGCAHCGMAGGMGARTPSGGSIDWMDVSEAASDILTPTDPLSAAPVAPLCTRWATTSYRSYPYP